MWKRWNVTEKHFWPYKWVVPLAKKFELWSHISEHALLWSSRAETMFNISAAA